MNGAIQRTAAFTAIVAVATAACARSEAPPGAAGTPEPRRPEAPADGRQEATVRVRLVDFVLEANPESVPAGEITFDVRNDGFAIGKDGNPIESFSGGRHNLVVLRTNLPPGALPQSTESPGQPVDTAAPGIEFVDYLSALDAGSRESLTTDLEPGSYALICNLRAHYELGMWAALSVG